MMRATLIVICATAGVVHLAGAQAAPRMVSGRIFDDSTGCPLRGAQVTAGESAGRVVADSHGRYRMANPPGGIFSMQAVLRGYQPQPVEGVIVTDSTSRVDFSLLRAMGDSTGHVVYPKQMCRLEPAGTP